MPSWVDMRQVSEMLDHVKPDHPLRIKLRQAESLLRRDIVEHSLALGFAPIQLPEIARDELDEAKAERPTPPRTRRGKKSGAAAATQTPSISSSVDETASVPAKRKASRPRTAKREQLPVDDGSASPAKSKRATKPRRATKDANA